MAENMPSILTSSIKEITFRNILPNAGGFNIITELGTSQSHNVKNRSTIGAVWLHIKNIYFERSTNTIHMCPLLFSKARCLPFVIEQRLFIEVQPGKLNPHELTCSVSSYNRSIFLLF